MAYAHRRRVHRVGTTVAAVAARAFHALLKANEAAVPATAVLAANVLAPRIVLRVGRRTCTNGSGGKSKRDQELSHGLSPGLALVLDINAQASFIFAGTEKKCRS